MKNWISEKKFRKTKNPQKSFLAQSKIENFTQISIYITYIFTYVKYVNTYQYVSDPALTIWGHFRRVPKRLL